MHCWSEDGKGINIWTQDKWEIGQSWDWREDAEQVKWVWQADWKTTEEQVTEDTKKHGEAEIKKTEVSDKTNHKTQKYLKHRI